MMTLLGFYAAHPQQSIWESIRFLLDKPIRLAWKKLMRQTVATDK